MPRPRHHFLVPLTVATLVAAIFATAALAAPPPRRDPGKYRGAPKPRSQCAYQIQIAEFKIVKLDKTPRSEPKGYNAPMRFDITLKNIGTGPYLHRFGHDVELVLGARGKRPGEGGGIVRKARLREFQPGQSVRIHWNYDYDTRSGRMPKYEAIFQAAIWNACNRSYPWSSREYRRAIPVFQWARDAFKKYHRGEATRF